MPVYQVRLKAVEPQTRLIEAKNQSQAVAFAIKDWVSASKPEPADLVRLGGTGLEIETATESSPGLSTAKAGSE